MRISAGSASMALRAAIRAANRAGRRRTLPGIAGVRRNGELSPAAAARSTCRIGIPGSSPRVVGEDRVHGLLRGRSGAANGPAAGTASGRRFPAAPQRALCIARQNSRPCAILHFVSALRCASGAGPDRPPPFVAMKAAMGAVDPTKGSTP